MDARTEQETYYDVVHRFGAGIGLSKCSLAEARAFKKARKGNGYDVKIVKHKPPLPFSISCDWEDD